MSKNTRIILLVLAAAVVLIWGLGMKEDKSGGYSDETNYFSEEELEARRKVIDEMAVKRGETPKPSATPEPEKDEVEKVYGDVEMQELPQSLSLKRAGYDAAEQVLVAEFNMTGLIYAYYDVPQEEWDKLLEAADFDKWFEFMIMKKFSFKQLN